MYVAWKFPVCNLKSLNIPLTGEYVGFILISFIGGSSLVDNLLYNVPIYTFTFSQVKCVWFHIPIPKISPILKKKIDNFWTVPKMSHDFWSFPKMVQWILTVPCSHVKCQIFALSSFSLLFRTQKFNSICHCLVTEQVVWNCESLHVKCPVCHTHTKKKP